MESIKNVKHLTFYFICKLKLYNLKLKLPCFILNKFSILFALDNFADEMDTYS